MIAPVLQGEQKIVRISMQSMLKDLKIMETCMGTHKKESVDDLIWVTPYYKELPSGEIVRQGSVFYTEDDSGKPFYRRSENEIAYVPICFRLKDIKPAFKHIKDKEQTMVVLLPPIETITGNSVGFLSATVDKEPYFIQFSIVENKDIPSIFKPKYITTYKHFIDVLDITSAGMKTEPNHIKQSINIKFLDTSKVVLYMGIDRVITYGVLDMSLIDKVAAYSKKENNIEFINYGTARHFVKAARLYMPALFSEKDLVEIKESTENKESGASLFISTDDVATEVQTYNISPSFYSSWDTINDELNKRSQTPITVISLDLIEKQLTAAFNFHTEKKLMLKKSTKDVFVSSSSGTFIILQAYDNTSFSVKLSNFAGNFRMPANFYNFYLYIAACKRSGFGKVGLFTTDTAIILETQMGSGIIFS